MRCTRSTHSGGRKVVTLIHDGSHIDFFEFSDNGDQLTVGYVGTGNKTDRVHRGSLVK